jgi:beta-1,4-mannosyl-glycoprotein beta-1,4-N-acetylglucosaminyltransferase
MKIFDCFSFSHELDILEIRLNELDDIVDVFVLTESEQTFTGLKKELFFNNNKKRFEKFLPKIRHVIVPPVLNLPTIHDYAIGQACDSCWQREHFQMNYFFNFLSDVKEDDILLINPVDEIPRNEVLKREIPNITTPKCLVVDLYFYKLNLLAINNQETLDLLESNPEHGRQRRRLNNTIGEAYKWYGSFISQAKYISNNYWPQQHHQKPYMEIIEDAGWHYTYVSKEEDILRKIQSFSHADHFKHMGADNIESIMGAINECKEIIPADRDISKIQLNINNTPKYVIKNQDKFAHLIS